MNILIIGECKGGEEGVSEGVHALGCKNVTTTDILDSLPDSWLRKNTDWQHIKADFVKFDSELKYDYIASISVFEHFGMFWEGKAYDFESELDDMVLWNHDLRGIEKACSLLRDQDSKLFITLPAGPYMNYQPSGYPFLRYYDAQRQSIVKQKIKEAGYYLSNESFFVSNNFVEWFSVNGDINIPENCIKYCNSYTPNIIWAFTVQKK